MPKPKCESFEESRSAAGRCPACEILVINGRRCHEGECPEAWRDSTRSCFECGCDFKPEKRFQNLCPDCQEQADERLEDACLDEEACISDDNWACGTLDPET